MARVMVGLDSKIHAEAKAVSDITGIPIAEMLRQAMSDWLECVGKGHVENVQNGRALVVTTAALRHKTDALKYEAAAVLDKADVVLSGAPDIV